MEKPPIQSLCPGRYWQDIKAGDRFRTLRRTISEPDLVNFVATTGMLEAIFIDQTFDSAMQGRAVPGALTCGLIEGLQFQTLLQATGLAMLELSMKALKPVMVGDTIDAVIEIVEVRPTSKGNRAIVSSDIGIFNQRDELVMTYAVKRMLAGRPE